MKSFLGVIGQFREHVDHFGDITSSLYDIVENYQSSKHNRINWTPELTEAYENVKQKVANCPKLFFIDEQDPIFLSADFKHRYRSLSTSRKRSKKKSH